MQGGFKTVNDLVLASGSPRRRDFLQELGLDFVIRTAPVDESVQSGEGPESFVLRLAREKAQAVSCEHDDVAVLAADTVVVVDGEILGKPGDSSEAFSMLRRLSGRCHEVWTGYCLSRKSDDLMACRAVRTKVYFRSLDEKLCRAYVLTGEPLDKAGSYGLQGRGGFLVEKIEGSYSNVIGLPVAEVVEEMLDAGVIEPLTD